MDEPNQDYPWVGTRDKRFSLALVLDSGKCSAGTAIRSQRGHARRPDCGDIPSPSSSRSVSINASRLSQTGFELRTRR